MKKNKAWLKKEIEDYLAIEGVYDARMALKATLDYVDQLDEPEKVVVSKMEKVIIPQFIADWIERSKQKGHKLVNAMLYFYVLGIDSDDVNKYINKNYETFVRAWLDGYTIIPERNMQVIIKSYDKTELEIELPESEANELIEKLRGAR